MQVSEGKVKLEDMLTLHKSDMVPGSGILTYHFSDGATFPLRDAVRLMIVYSDNTATNLVLDHIGLASTNKRLDAWGYPHTRLQRQGLPRQQNIARQGSHQEVRTGVDDRPRDARSARKGAPGKDRQP